MSFYFGKLLLLAITFFLLVSTVCALPIMTGISWMILPQKTSGTNIPSPLPSQIPETPIPVTRTPEQQQQQKGILLPDVTTAFPSGTPTPVNSIVPPVSPTSVALLNPTLTPIPEDLLQFNREGYHLALNETFDGTEINPELWNTKLRWGSTNPPELQRYRADALHLQSGILTITAKKHQSGKYSYSSGLIASYDRFYFQYGYIEVRAKVPKGKGLWPALWMLAQDPQSASEIDIMELIGSAPDQVHTTVHYGQIGGDLGIIGTIVNGPDYSEDFHNYAVDWQWDKVIWYIDGKEVFRITDHIPREPMYILANLAVGGEWPGPPDETTVFPANFEIDFIRVFTP